MPGLDSTKEREKKKEKNVLGILEKTSDLIISRRDVDVGVMPVFAASSLFQLPSRTEL